MFSGTVEQLWRYPVKSMGGERVPSTRVDARGAGGDRTHAIVHEHKGAIKPLTAREAPRLLLWRAAYPAAPGAALDPADPPPAQLVAPDGTSYVWPDAGLRRRIAEDAAREVGLRRDTGGIQDIPGTLLVTTEATLAALSGELGHEVDLRRFRTNLHLRLDAPAWAESDWEGGHVEIEGGVVLRLLHPCERCAIPTRDPGTAAKWPGLLRHLAAEHHTLFGINAAVESPGRIAAGAGVAVHPAP